jgi:type I restriction enzyme M protein
MLPNELFYNTGIFTYIWLLRNDRAAIGSNGRIMLIDGRQQFEKEPKSFGSKRNRITEQHRQWIEHRYHHGWEDGFTDADLRFFTRHDFSFHKVEVVFWQTDEDDQPAIITEPFPVQFKAANVRAKQEFYASDMTLHIRVALAADQHPASVRPHPRPGGQFS